MLPCIVCGTVLQNTVADVDNQPSKGTEFQTYGHYGSTFWDSFQGEEIVINVCDKCLRAHTDRIGRQKRYVNIMAAGVRVGRQWVNRALVPWFDGPEDDDRLNIEPEDIGVMFGTRVEWVEHWAAIKSEIEGSTP